MTLSREVKVTCVFHVIHPMEVIIQVGDDPVLKLTRYEASQLAEILNGLSQPKEPAK